MLSTWGGDGFDTITEEELKEVGYDSCEKYCAKYCWDHGIGYCPNCAYDKERIKRRKAESEEVRDG